MDMNHVLTIATIVFASTGFWNLVTEMYKKKAGVKSVISKAVLALLHDKLYYLCEKHIHKGSITVDEFDNLTYLFEPYKEMGGNGVCEHLYNECKALPKKKEGSK